MSSNDALRVDVVKREDKEARLAEFIRACLQGAGGEPRIGIDNDGISVIARSFASPVMRALESALGDVAGDTIKVRSIVLEKPERAGGRSTALLRSHDTRWLEDHRLVDAHEQLVLTAASCWIGDCMRRDPDKRDAFETWTTASVEATALAARSFERLWAMATPIARVPRAPKDRAERAVAAGQVEAPLPPGPAEPAPATTVTTRH